MGGPLGRVQLAQLDSATSIAVAVPAARSAEEMESSLDYLLRGLTREGRPTGLTYLSYVGLHPMNLFAVVAAAAVGLLSGSLPLLAAAFGFEVIVMAALPRMEKFRAAVHAHADRLRRARNTRSRELVMAQMSPPFRRELERLEFLVDCIRFNATRNNGAAAALLGDHLDLGKLVEGYIRLSIAHTERAALQQRISRPALEGQIARLEAELDHALSPIMRRLLERRLAIVIRRAEHWDRTDRSLRMISQQLATIGDVVDLIYAQSVSPTGIEVSSEELERSMAELEETDNVLAELDELDRTLLEESRQSEPSMQARAEAQAQA